VVPWHRRVVVVVQEREMIESRATLPGCSFQKLGTDLCLSMTLYNELRYFSCPQRSIFTTLHHHNLPKHNVVNSSVTACWPSRFLIDPPFIYSSFLPSVRSLRLLVDMETDICYPQGGKGDDGS